MQELLEDIRIMWSYLKEINVIDVIDILIVAVILYFVYKFIRNRRAGRLAIGILLLLLVFIISSVLNMHALTFLLSNLFQVGIIAVVILFQPELRAALERVGNQPLRGLKAVTDARSSAQISSMISNICDAVCDLSSTKTGALIVIERETKLGDIEKTGTEINADVNSALIKNIFFNKAPLHDGAVIISQQRIHSAGCFLPLSEKNDIYSELGTRHRAAIGISENSDAITIVVSEETGVISLALDGELKRNFDYTALKNQLYSLLVSDGVRGRARRRKDEKADGGTTEGKNK